MEFSYHNEYTIPLTPVPVVLDPSNVVQRNVVESHFATLLAETVPEATVVNKPPTYINVPVESLVIA